MIGDSNPHSKDLVIIQRSDDNSFYEEVHASGSLVIPYLDADGHLNFDTSQSFYSIFPPISAPSNYSISSSWASQSLSASWAPGGTPTYTSSLWGTASWAISASWAPDSGTSLTTGSTYPVTSS